jgi:hypothetical protein
MKIKNFNYQDGLLTIEFLSDISQVTLFLSNKLKNKKASKKIPIKIPLDINGSTASLDIHKTADELAASPMFQLYSGENHSINDQFTFEDQETIVEFPGFSLQLHTKNNAFLIKTTHQETSLTPIVNQVGDTSFSFEGEGNYEDYMVSIDRRIHGVVFDYFEESALLPITGNSFELDFNAFKDFVIRDLDIFDFYLVDKRGKKTQITVNDFSKDYKTINPLLKYKLYKTGRKSLALYFSTSFKFVCDELKLDQTMVTIQTHVSGPVSIMEKDILLEEFSLLHHGDIGQIRREYTCPAFSYEMGSDFKTTFSLQLSAEELYKNKEQSEFMFAVKVKYKDQYYQFLHNFDPSCSLLSEVKGFSIKKGNNNELILSRLVLERDKQVSLAVFGSCYSRRAFSTSDYFNPKYKNRYNVKLTQFHSTVMSIVNEKKSYFDEKLFSHFHPIIIDYIKTDFQKDFFTKLKETNVDYVIVDLYSDFQKGTIKFSDGRAISASGYIDERCDYLLTQSLDNSTYLSPYTTENFFDEWEKAATIFSYKLKEIVPEENIIIHFINAVTEYKDHNGNVQKFKVNLNRLKSMNMIADYMNNYLAKLLPKAVTIDSRKLEFIGDEGNPDGLLIHHYESGYYKEVLRLIDESIVKSLAQK